jgi:hypothetical protein
MYNIRPIDTNTLSPQTFSVEDATLMQSFDVTGLFNPVTDRVEYFIYDFNNNLLSSEYNFNSWTNTNDPSLASTTFTLPTSVTGSSLDAVNSPQTAKISTINLDPVKDVETRGYSFGKVKTVYNFISPKLGSSNDNRYYISEISPDRTEIRLKSNFISNDSLQILYDEFKNELNNSPYFDEFYLNFGGNEYFLSVNILLDTTSTQYSILIKLYEPLPAQYKVKNELFVVVKSGESVGYAIEFTEVIDLTGDSIKIQPANFNLEIQDSLNPSTQYKSYDSITSTPLSGSLYQLLNVLSGSTITLTTDYSDYNEFIFFSSAYQRLYNFKEKVLNISSSQAQLDLIYSSITGSTSSSFAVSASKVVLENQIQETITNFDNYERFLYFESSSATWPKQNTVAPYILFDPTSSQAISWYNNQTASAILYDENNQNNLEYTIPGYLRDDSDNDQYILFVNMVGQLFDGIWIYTKAITDKLDANSSLDIGVSKDVVADVLKSLGTKLYTSNFTSENIYNSLLGYSNSGSILVPTGNELITNYVTSSISSSEVPSINDFDKLTYKKLYHNLPYLVKTKGTLTGLKALITTFGIPDTILRINEFGGKDRNNTNDWDYWQNQFNYAFDTEGQYLISSSFELNSSWTSQDPLSVQLRFQTRNIPTNVGYYSQSLWATNEGVALRLLYTGSGYTSGSYSGSIPDTYNQYAKLDFLPNPANTTVSASVYLPFYDGGWWSAMVTKQGNTYVLYAGNKIYSGSDGSQLGFFASSSVSYSGTEWASSVTSYFPSSSGTLGKLFSGSLQEIRYYTTALSESVFKDYVMNPYSIEGNGINSAPDQLAFRASLGGELYTSSISIHPKVTGSWATTSSFASNSTFYISSSNFVNNYEYIFFDQIPVGIQNAISNKISTQNIVLPTSSSLDNIPNADVVSPFKSIQQQSYVSGSYTSDLNYVEVAISPQNEINEDINSSLGYFNIGEYIGDPRQVSSSAVTYPDLDDLRDSYFEKYTGNYDYTDLIRIIKYFDNSLFKMIRDYVPARTSLAAGIVIKPHLLERNKYPVPQLTTQTTTSFEGSGSTPVWNTPFVAQDLTLTGSISASAIYSVTGSNGGVMPNLEGNISGAYAGFNISPITQSWTGYNPSLLGDVYYTQSSQDEFINGEFSGSNLTVTTQSLNSDNVFLDVNTTLVSYTASITASQNVTFTSFFNASIPSGRIQLFYDSSSLLSVIVPPNNTSVPSTPSSPSL